MSSFKSLQSKRLATSAPVAPTSSLLRPSRPLTPVSASAPKPAPPVTQAELERAGRLGYHFARIPLFPPASDDGRTQGEPLQGRFEPTQSKEKNTGLPDTLKAGIENLSGMSMDDVKVHYNSSKPVQLQALAYTQGMDIYLGPDQERHLPHEAWHVVQQMQGWVKPTTQVKGEAVNHNERLEREADLMGARANALQFRPQQNARTDIHTHAQKEKGGRRRLSENSNGSIQRMQYKSIDDPTVITNPNVDIGRFSESQCFLHLMIFHSGNHGNIVFQDGDKQRLITRFVQTGGDTLRALKKGLADAEEPGAGLMNRNITKSAAELIALLDEIQRDSRVKNFASWLHGNASKFLVSEDQLLDHINELREAKARLAELGAHQTLDLGETQIASSAQTADIAYGGIQVEIKTVQEPVQVSTGLRAQLLAGLNKFKNITTGGPYHVVVYGSYDSRLIGGGIERTQHGTTTRTRLEGANLVMENKRATEPAAAYAERTRRNFFADMDAYIQANAPALVSRVDIRMENGPSYRWERA